MVLSKSIEVRDSPVAGKGLFATAPIAAGERVWGPDPDEAARYYHTMEQIKTWSEEEQKHFMNNAYLVAPGTYSGATRLCASAAAAATRAGATFLPPFAPPPPTRAPRRRAIWRGERQGRVHEPLVLAQRP